MGALPIHVLLSHVVLHVDITLEMCIWGAKWSENDIKSYI